MEEEEKETSGKAILCLKVHLLCYFLLILIYCWSGRILVFWKVFSIIEQFFCYYVYVMEIPFLSLGIFFNFFFFIFGPLLCKFIIYKI